MMRIQLNRKVIKSYIKNYIKYSLTPNGFYLDICLWYSSTKIAGCH